MFLLTNDQGVRERSGSTAFGCVHIDLKGSPHASARANVLAHE
jgi:hypothetical protein